MTGPPLGEPAPLVEVDGLTVCAGEVPVVRDVGFTLPPGGSLGLVGASGSGKTTTALTLLGHVRDGMRHTAGQVRVAGRDVLPDPPAGLRGGTVGYLPQDPGQALNPYRRIGATLLDAAGRRVPRAERAGLVTALLGRVGLPGDPVFARRFPHQLSGGQQQRVALAVALSRDPALLVLDEPTTGLDVVTRAEVLAELARVLAGGVATLWVSHDLATLARMVDRLLVLDRGQVVEDAPTAQVLRRPASPAAARLVRAVPRPAFAGPVAPSARIGAAPGPVPVRPQPPPVLAARGIVAAHGRGDPVLHGVTLTVHQGGCVAVLGASGVGKTTLARCLAGLHLPAAGTVEVDGEPLAADVRRRSRRQRARLQLVAQDPAEALHPRQPVRTALVRPLRLLRGLRTGAELAAEVGRLLRAVHLDAGYADRLPGELSGGERQRVALARALAAGPGVLVCDEITASLDLVTQAAVLDLLAELRRELGLGVLLITHDVALAAGFADRLVVLADGRVAEEGSPAQVLHRPVSQLGRRLRDVLLEVPVGRRAEDGGGAVAEPAAATSPADLQ